MWWAVFLMIFLAMTGGQVLSIAFSSARRPGWRDGGAVPPKPVVAAADELWTARLLIEAKERDRELFAQNPLAFWNDPHRYDGLRLEEWEATLGECDPYENELGFGGFPDALGPSDPFAYSVDSDGAHRIERRDPLPVSYGRVRMKPVPVLWQGVARVPGTVTVRQLGDDA